MKYRLKGVTFIELIIVVAVLSLLSMFALNSYKEHRKKAMIVELNRALVEQVGRAQELRLRLGKAFTDRNFISEMNKDENVAIYYSNALIGKTVFSSNSAGSFLITLVISDQFSDLLKECSEMSIDHLNRKYPSPRESKCWRN